ncbi:MAG: DNA-3-methyladenine glycosylase [Hydrogenibacillus schlegelii]|uniref:Putative 3-methyladenine DNA glycosylase n=1 Tax=Hydrogenibacillus schlegelii TaxID=1484 RepID=A0A2T5GF72_HYDSH|nr:DNA-3-methyladenine glycosylase [Hydrogenibacillus schlegelii]PTQ54833.1 MAG: DNA-3-methyladenine glycosylase II [Hydrogenibacillus schlegelii]
MNDSRPLTDAERAWLDAHPPVSPDFFTRPTLELARALLGQILVHIAPDGVAAGRIVETEAYLGPHDKAAHSYGGRLTHRTRIMFGPPGFSYVYKIYGLYDCLNVTAGAEGEPQAVLIRAVEPIFGEALMRRRRNDPPERTRLTAGPGRLTQALGITTAHYGLPLFAPPLYIAAGEPVPPERIARGPRIGIDYAEEARHYPWRFWIDGHPFVSVLPKTGRSSGPTKSGPAEAPEPGDPFGPAKTPESGTSSGPKATTPPAEGSAP